MELKCTHSHTHAYTHKYTHIRTHYPTSVFVCLDIYIYMLFMCLHVWVRIHTSILYFICVYVRMCVHMYIYVHADSSSDCGSIVGSYAATDRRGRWVRQHPGRYGGRVFVMAKSLFIITIVITTATVSNITTRHSPPQSPSWHHKPSWLSPSPSPPHPYSFASALLAGTPKWWPSF